jgi:Flp pilus assembly CpaE family ATPase
VSRPVLIISPDKNLNAALARMVEHGGRLNRPVFLEYYPTFAQLGAFLSDHPNAHAGIVGFADPKSARKAIEILRVLQPDILAFGAHVEPAPTLAESAIRSGAVDFLTPPWDAGRLLARLEGVEFPTAGSTSSAGALLVFLPAQGGDGASTTALHVANRLAEVAAKSGARSGEVLLSDFDFHAGTTAFRLRLQPVRTIADALRSRSNLDDRWPRYLTRWRDLQILPPPPADDPLEPAEAFRAVELVASAKRRFRFSVFDLPPALYAACKDAALLAERVFVICSADRISLHLAERRVRDLMQLGLAAEQIKLIVNRADSDSRLRVEQIPYLEGVEAIAALPNDYRRVSDAYLAGDLVDLLSPYRQATDALAEKIYQSL